MKIVFVVYLYEEWEFELGFVFSFFFVPQNVRYHILYHSHIWDEKRWKDQWGNMIQL